jgi:hypothetical protein
MLGGKMYIFEILLIAYLVLIAWLLIATIRMVDKAAAWQKIYFAAFWIVAFAAAALLILDRLGQGNRYSYAYIILLHMLVGLGIAGYAWPLSASRQVGNKSILGSYIGHLGFAAGFCLVSLVNYVISGIRCFGLHQGAALDYRYSRSPRRLFQAEVSSYLQRVDFLDPGFVSYCGRIQPWPAPAVSSAVFLRGGFVAVRQRAVTKRASTERHLEIIATNIIVETLNKKFQRIATSPFARSDR